MEDKKVLEFINKHHEESYKDYIKTQKKKELKDRICCIMLFLTVIALVFILSSVINRQTQKAVKKCIKNGHSYTYCLKDAQ